MGRSDADRPGVLSPAAAEPDWHHKPWYSLDAWCKNTFGRKLYKVALDIGCTCPNRDGTAGTEGCTFCSAGGSGDFAVSGGDSLRSRLAEGADRLRNKWPDSVPGSAGVFPEGGAKRGLQTPRLIAYFQSYTNTYGDPDRLVSLFGEALSFPETAGISIATRPDCLDEEILARLSGLRTAFPDKFIWIELGLQTIHDSTALRIRRGYPSRVFYDAMERLRALGFPVIVHAILGLPGESRAEILQTMHAVNGVRPFGVKLQLLHILKGTALADEYASGAVRPLTKEEYVDLVTDCIASLSPEICIHRITGDGPAQLLIAPLWSKNKRDVLNRILAGMKEKGIRQGSYYEPSGTADSL